ncbi:hypothetical protein KP509_20G077500 [Ceratopteris richardii]|uniref:Cyanobacterial aminoacyl-tRNA synthetase CAAD domain-containing protein n=1 Tax=Ceratopteris richardii TaxID=49495 RepID=A0A8T2SIB6_CERRI|nr:hypothetical protein KP509_20G077500 [Ceratopteris richardii]
MKQNSYAGNYDHLPGHYNSPRTHVSARKLAASLWELQEQSICGSSATQTSSKKYAHSQKRRINNLALGKEMRAQSITYPSSLASSTNSCSEATVQVKVSTIRGTSNRSPLPMIETVLMKLGAGGEETLNRGFISESRNECLCFQKILELVGLGYSGWFVCRYLLFKENRKELVVEIEKLKTKITRASKE